MYDLCSYCSQSCLILFPVAGFCFSSFALCRGALLTAYVVECRMKNCETIWKDLVVNFRERLGKTVKQFV
jgi:hypothetical protein